MNYQKQYRTMYQEALKNNFKEVREKLKNGDSKLLEKIKKRSLEYGIPYDNIVDDMMQCDTALISFVINPSRQNIYEKIASDMVREISGVSQFENLPNNKIYISRGAIITKDELKHYPQAKTLDFKFIFNNYTIYASHKYTKGSGGMQDNQYKDLQVFLRESRDTRLKNTIFVAIADGDFYLTENGRANTTKIQHLKGLCTKTTIACRMEDLAECLNKACI